MRATDSTALGAAGAMVSTPAELCTFARALFAGDLVNDASLERMMTLRYRLGRGLMQIPFYERSSWGHSGVWQAH